VPEAVDTKFVKYEVKDRVAWVTLNRPEAMNALSQGLLADLGTVFRAIARDDDVLVVILTGEGGRAFSAGADLKEMAARQAEQVATGATRTISPPDGAVSNPFDAVGKCRKPVIAAIDGYCLAGGFELAICCDIRVASAKSVFGLPESRRSILAWPGLINLPRMIPLSEALRIALTGSPISSERAYQIGIIQEVAADRDEVFKVAQGIAEEILLGAPLAMQEIKRLVKEGVEMTIPQAEMLREILSAQLAQTEDALEGPKAFAEKRAPVWKMR
jgi:enoyl-CoA hydratase/carnithine racemase